MLPQITSKIQNHIDLSNEEALWLFELEDEAQLREVYALADQVNEEKNHGVVSYIHNMNFNYTNVCELYCTFCAFRRDGDEADAYVRTPEHILAAVEGRAISEITIQGGLTEKVPFEAALDIFRAVKKKRPEIPPPARPRPPENKHGLSAGKNAPLSRSPDCRTGFRM